MNLVHVISGVREEASGPSYTVPRLCQALAARGHDVTLSSSGTAKPVPGVRLDLHAQWPVLRRFAVSPGLARALTKNASTADIIHNHGLWSMVNVASGWVVPGRRAKLVLSPRGMLAPWALGWSRRSKRLVWPLQCRALARADLLHATSMEEFADIRAQGFRAPVAVIANGIDLPAVSARFSGAGGRTLLFLSRLHPIKGVDRLLHAWQALQDQHPDWQLVIAGRGESAHVREVAELAARLGVQRVSFPGPLYGADKSQAYSDADLFVLPSHSENFGVVVAEALAHGCPAVVSRGAPWSGLETEGCGWWVEHDVLALASALDKAMSLPVEALTEMGLRGRTWMERDFSWASIAQRMETAYGWLLDGGTPPPWVLVE